jgi:hypothetical protein
MVDIERIVASGALTPTTRRRSGGGQHVRLLGAAGLLALCTLLLLPLLL